MRNFFKWLLLPTHRFRRQTWGGCGFGPTVESERYGRVTRLWRARKDTSLFTGGCLYAIIEYDDCGHGQVPFGCLHYDKSLKLYNQMAYAYPVDAQRLTSA